MKNRIAGLFLALALLFAMPAFGQSNTPSTPEVKEPISVVLMSDSDNPPTPVINTLVDGIKSRLADGFTINTSRPAKDDPTQYVVVIMAFSTINVVDGKQVPSNVLNVTGKLHVKGHDFGFYLFSAPVQIETANQADQVADAVIALLGEADGAIAEDGGPNKL